jgi:hypothetical protein
MLNALIKAENDLNHIRDIVRVEQRGGEQFHLSPGQAHASQAEKTIQRYGGGNAASALLLELTYQSALVAAALTTIQNLSMASTL